MKTDEEKNYKNKKETNGTSKINNYLKK